AIRLASVSVIVLSRLSPSLIGHPRGGTGGEPRTQRRGPRTPSPAGFGPASSASGAETPRVVLSLIPVAGGPVDRGPASGPSLVRTDRDYASCRASQPRDGGTSLRPTRGSGRKAVSLPGRIAVRRRHPGRWCAACRGRSRSPGSHVPERPCLPPPTPC